MARDYYPFETTEVVIERYKAAVKRETDGAITSFSNETGASSRLITEHPSITRRKCIESLQAKGYPVEQSWISHPFSLVGISTTA